MLVATVCSGIATPPVYPQIGFQKESSGQRHRHIRSSKLCGGRSGMTKPVAPALGRTPPNLALLRSHRRDIMELATRYGVSNIRVFGSVARGDATSDSDIDLLVDFTVQASGLDVIAFAQELEDLLGYQVDIGTKVHRVIRDQVEREAVPL